MGYQDFMELITVFLQDFLTESYDVHPMALKTRSLGILAPTLFCG